MNLWMFLKIRPCSFKFSVDMLKKYFLSKTHSHSSYHLFNFLRSEIYYSFQHKRSLKKQYNIILSQQAFVNKWVSLLFFWKIYSFHILNTSTSQPLENGPLNSVKVMLINMYNSNYVNSLNCSVKVLLDILVLKNCSYMLFISNFVLLFFFFFFI